MPVAGVEQTRVNSLRPEHHTLELIQVFFLKTWSLRLIHPLVECRNSSISFNSVSLSLRPQTYASFSFYPDVPISIYHLSPSSRSLLRFDSSHHFFERWLIFCS